MYNCGECKKTIPANQPLKKKILFREVTDKKTGAPRKEIEREVPLCETCFRAAEESDLCALSGTQ